MEQVGGNRRPAAASPPSFSFLTYNTAKLPNLGGLALLLDALPSPAPSVIFLQEVTANYGRLTAMARRVGFTAFVSAAPLACDRRLVCSVGSRRSQLSQTLFLVMPSKCPSLL